MSTREWNEGLLLKLSGGYWETCALHAGVKLDVFTVIGENRLSAGEVAERLGADARAAGMLLNALSAMALLNKTAEGYANGPVARQLLSKDSPKYIGFMIMHHHHLMASWAQLDEAVMSGKPVRTRISLDDPERRESFLMGMFNLAMGVAPRLVKEIDLSDRTRLLDLGGGPGTYAIHFCLENPNLKGVVYDLPTSRSFAEKTVARFGVSDRVTFTPGDYVNEEIGGTYDAAWMSHILHGESPGVCQRIFRKTAAALRSGGLIMVHDFILDDAMDGPLFPALFSLNMLLGTDGGQAYSEKQIRTMMADAGVADIERHPFVGPNDSGVLIGRVP